MVAKYGREVMGRVRVDTAQSRQPENTGATVVQLDEVLAANQSLMTV